MTNLLCNPDLCPHSSKGDGVCDPSCMFAFCNFDSNSTVNPMLNHENSDCYHQCIDEYSCLPSDLGNGICNQDCNNPICGYDLGDCGYCSSNCYQANLSRSCVDTCNNQNCYYGLGACKDCSPDCNYKMLGDEICDDSCNVFSCNYDFGDCNNNKCNPDCERWMIGDNNCNEECNNLACSWDGGDCDCSQDCHSYMQSNEVCEAVCDNLACDYDGGDCKECAPGCLKSMLGDRTCNPACNVSDCYYDNYDCGCADGCGIESYGQCKDSCMNSFCRYDTISSTSKCQNANQILFSLHYGFIFKDLTINISPNNCTNITGCSLAEALDPSSCHTKCKNSNCINSWNMCDSQTCADSNCLVCNSENLGDCFKCNSNTYQFYGYCLTKCPGGHEAFILLGNYPVCLLPNDYSTKENPTVSYVTSLSSTDIYEGDGSFSNPFTSLSLALASVYSKYSIIYLFNDGDHYLTCVSLSNPVSTALADVCNPLNRSFKIKNLLITSYSNSTIALQTKSDNNFPVFAIQNSTMVTIKNVIFSGKEILSTCSSSVSSYCSYCANATLKSDGYYYSDQGIRLINFLNTSTCINYHNKTLFNMYLNSKLALQNVNFTDWRMELNSIVTSYGGNVIFTNVNFDNIRCNWAPVSKSGSWNNSLIYFLDCGDTNYNCGSFEYITGVISRLNNGYEYGAAQFSGFLSADKIRTVKLKNVTFINNVVYSPYVDSTAYSLIKLLLFRSIEISHCIFEKNIANYGLIYLSSNSLVFRNDVNSDSEIIDLLLYHVYIYDTIIKSNFAYNGMLTAVYNDQLQRILLANLSLIGNAVEKPNGGNMIYISGNGYPYIKDQKQEIKNANGDSIIATFKKRDFIFKDSIITQNNSGGYLALYLYRLCNARIKNLIVENNGLESKNANEILWNDYVANSNLYTKKLISDPKSIDCCGLGYLNYLYNHELSRSRFINNDCKNGCSNLYYYYSENTTLTDIIFEKSICNNGSGSCLCVYNAKNFRINNSIFNNNANPNQGSAVLDFSIHDAAYIENTIISNNIVCQTAVIQFYGTSLFLNNVTMESNSAHSGPGTIFYQTSKGTITDNNYTTYILDIKNSIINFVYNS